MTKKKKKSKSKKTTNATASKDVEAALLTGKNYEGLVVTTGINSMEVSIGQAHLVLVYRERFAPAIRHPAAPITCFVARGDRVFLTVIPNNKQNADIKWVAVKCWTEDRGKASDDPPIKQHSVPYAITHVSAAKLHFGKDPNILVAPAELIELFGYDLEGVNLTSLFRPGDVLEVELTAADPDRGGCVMRAWHGSCCEDKKRPPIPEQRTMCLQFCSSREVPKDTLLMIMVRGDMKHIEEVDQFSDEEPELKYIEPSKQPSIVTYDQLKQVQECVNISGSPAQSTISSGPQQLSAYERLHDAVPTSGLNQPETADASTQTHCTGEVFFFAIAHDV